MIRTSFSCLKSFSSLVGPLSILIVALVAFEPVAFGQAGRGASSDAWFIKDAKPKRESLQRGIKGGE